MGGLVAGLATSESDLPFSGSTKPRPSAGKLRIYLGTVPDYSAGDEVKGLRLTGVSSNGPADQAGLQGGDTIVKLAGKTIENIYDYTYVLNSLKVGEPTEIVVLRQGVERVLSILPMSRD